MLALKRGRCPKRPPVRDPVLGPARGSNFPDGDVTGAMSQNVLGHFHDNFPDSKSSPGDPHRFARVLALQKYGGMADLSTRGGMESFGH